MQWEYLQSWIVIISCTPSPPPPPALSLSSWYSHSLSLTLSHLLCIASFVIALLLSLLLLTLSHSGSTSTCWPARCWLSVSQALKALHYGESPCWQLPNGATWWKFSISTKPFLTGAVALSKGFTSQGAVTCIHPCSKIDRISIFMFQETGQIIRIKNDLLILQSISCVQKAIGFLQPCRECNPYNGQTEWRSARSVLSSIKMMEMVVMEIVNFILFPQTSSGSSRGSSWYYTNWLVSERRTFSIQYETIFIAVNTLAHVHFTTVCRSSTVEVLPPTNYSNFGTFRASLCTHKHSAVTWSGQEIN